MAGLVGYPDLFLFGVAPYAALCLAIAGTLERYRRHPFSCSTHSSQFLENRQHFWGETAFHYGIILVLIGHLVVFLLPAQVLAWSADWRRLVATETAALALGLLAFVGLAVILIRRVVTPAVRRVTRPIDWILYGLLLVQIGSGIASAVLYPWGSSWFASALAPYLWSLLRVQPDASVVAAMPLLVKLHVAAAFAVVALFPFSRLVHIIAVPNPYLWRRPQVVRWRHRPAPVHEHP
jgi:nitrate reductase gamma subunit